MRDKRNKDANLGIGTCGDTGRYPVVLRSPDSDLSLAFVYTLLNQPESRYRRSNALLRFVRPPQQNVSGTAHTATL